MKNKFIDHNEFDKYVWEQDKWTYDNGWNYRGESYSAHLLERLDKVESGKLVDYFVMLRDDDRSNKTVVLHGKNAELTEIWSGFVNSTNEYQVMMSVLNEFINEYKNNSGAI